MLDTDLRAQLGVNQLGPQAVNTRTFGGNLVGPTLRVKPGDTLRINVINNLPPNPDEHTVFAARGPGHNANRQRLLAAGEPIANLGTRHSC